MPAVAPFARRLAGAAAARLRARSSSRDWAARRRAAAGSRIPATRSSSFDRNYLRHRVLPPLRAALAGGRRARVARSAAPCGEAQRLLDELARADLAPCGRSAPHSSCRVLRALAPARRRNALRYWIRAAGCSLPSSRQLEQIVRRAAGRARAIAQPVRRLGGRAACGVSARSGCTCKRHARRPPGRRARPARWHADAGAGAAGGTCGSPAVAAR